MRFEITRYFAATLAAVSLRARGHATWRAEVAVRTGSEPIRVKLAKKP